MKKIARDFLIKLYPRPHKIKSIGKNSIILFPRKLQGSHCITVGSNTIIKGKSWIAAFESWHGVSYNPRIRIGSNCRIGSNVIITAIANVDIKDGCLLSEQVFISDHFHKNMVAAGTPTTQPLGSNGAVQIGENCFIGIRACIMSGVTLGDHCIVGANSVVTKSFPAGSVIAGAPAKLIRTNTSAT